MNININCGCGGGVKILQRLVNLRTFFTIKWDTNIFFFFVVWMRTKRKIQIATYPTKMAFSAFKKSMKYRVANTENIVEYGFKVLVSWLTGDECSTGFILDVNPNAGLSNARTFEPTTCAKGFITRFHEKTEAPKPCNKIIGKLTLLAKWGYCELDASSTMWGYCDLDDSSTASQILWCSCTPLNSQKELSGSARWVGSCNSSWSMPATPWVFFFRLTRTCSGKIKGRLYKPSKSLDTKKLVKENESKVL